MLEGIGGPVGGASLASRAGRAHPSLLRAVVLGAVGLLVVWQVTLRVDRTASAASLSVEPMRLVGAPPVTWSAHRFTDSLLFALGLRLGGSVEREVPGRTETTFVLSGTVEAQHTRLVIVASLRRRRDSEVLWGATFWRDSAAVDTIIDEVAEGVAQAIRQAFPTSAHPARGGTH